jgi:hypothetical protein
MGWVIVDFVMAILGSFRRPGFQPFLTPYTVSGHFGAVPTAPVTPACRSKAPSWAGYGSYLEVPRSHLVSLDDPRARWPLP